ncbi:hypothetical protein PF011_g27262 [Phytophthora fragariae]|uniref:Uncharacterized protein n=1 Tax=Phytophthora fragariae TaxID=53985 RepID=A0A6A3HE56_9STRA|nr:hypothetical protein PF011_g27262 [Phytophthora fragariae]
MTDSHAHSPLQRHPKCSALYAMRLRRNSQQPSEPLAPSVAYLANVTVEVTTKTPLSRDASTFALTVHDCKSSSTWRHLRSYADCRAFQARVLQVLSRGHFCFAECPWLFAYVQRALPAERPGHHLFRVAGHGPKPRVVENQRQALARLFATLQRVLLNPLNQKCSVVMQQVAPEVITFMTNRSEVADKESLNSPTTDRPLAKTFSESFMFEMDGDDEPTAPYGQVSTTTTASLDDLEDEELPIVEEVATLEKVVAGQRVCCAMCALHRSRSDEQVFACWRAEPMSSRFMRLRAGAGAERVSIAAKRQQPAQSTKPRVKGVWESPTYSQRVTSPLESLAVLGGRGSDVVVVEHDGTPKDPFPGSPGTPPRDSAASSRTSSVCEIDLVMLDSWNLSAPALTPKTPTVSPSPTFENIRRMPPSASSSTADPTPRSGQQWGGWISAGLDHEPSKTQAAALMLWAPDEDALLRDAVRQHGVRRWEYVASAVPNRSVASCSARWEELQRRRSRSRQAWTEHEDKLLSAIVDTEGAGQWTIVASFLPGRNAKQCRERWHHQLNPSIKREAWSTDEDALLVTLQQNFGNAWSRMVPHLPGRTDNAIKNRWHSASFRARVQYAGSHDWGPGDLTSESQASAMAPVSPLGFDGYATGRATVSPLESSVVDDLEGMWADVAACLIDEDPHEGDGHDGE